MKGRFRFLGTGGSMGIPMVGCKCPVCTSNDPKNKRLRPGALVTLGEKIILIDTSQDIRTQLLTANIDHIDALLLTHTHHDHTAGVDDLRALEFQGKGKRIWVMNEATHKDLEVRYHYIFNGQDQTMKVVPKFDLRILEGERGEMELFGHSIRYFTFQHAGMGVLGFRFGDLAYLSDIKTYPETIFEDLKGVRTLIVSALRHEESHIHFNIEEALNFAEKVNPGKVFFTHVGHELEHKKTDQALPSHVQLAFDGLELEFRGMKKGFI